MQVFIRVSSCGFRCSVCSVSLVVRTCCISQINGTVLWLVDLRANDSGGGSGAEDDAVWLWTFNSVPVCPSRASEGRGAVSEARTL